MLSEIYVRGTSKVEKDFVLEISMVGESGKKM